MNKLSDITMEEALKLKEKYGDKVTFVDPQTEEWESKAKELKNDFLSLHYGKFSNHNDMESVWAWFKIYIENLHITKADEIRKAEENAKTNILRELKQMADKEVKISMVAGEIIQVRQLEVIQTVAKLHNVRL